MDLMVLEIQFNVYTMDVGCENKFLRFKGIDKPAKKMVETKNNKLYSLAYLLVILAFVLPIATTIAKKAI